jgi:hypothetical protein
VRELLLMPLILLEASMITRRHLFFSPLLAVHGSTLKADTPIQVPKQFLYSWIPPRRTTVAISTTTTTIQRALSQQSQPRT